MLDLVPFVQFKKREKTPMEDDTLVKYISVTNDLINIINKSQCEFHFEGSFLLSLALRRPVVVCKGKSFCSLLSTRCS